MLARSQLQSRWTHALAPCRPAAWHARRALPVVGGYKFGDLTRGAKEGLDKLGQAVTGDEGYKFGDISKKLGQEAKEGIDKLGQAVTGDDSYRFGDLTRKTLEGIKQQAGQRTLQVQQLSKEALAKLQNYEFGSLTKSLLDSEWGKEVVSGAEAAGRTLTGRPDYRLGDVSRGVAAQLGQAKDRAAKLLALPADVDQLKQIVLEQQILINSLTKEAGTKAEAQSLMQLTGSADELKPLILEQQEVIDVLLSHDGGHK